jgi:uncharacterized membrane protein (DUF106 family)
MTPTEEEKTPTDEAPDLEVQEASELEVQEAPEATSTTEDDGFRVVEAEDEDDIVVVETPEERRERRRLEEKRKEEAERPKPRMNFWMILMMMGVLFIMIDPALRSGTATLVGFIMEPLVGFDGRYPTMTIILTGMIMIFLTTILRHVFIDWLRIARVQNTMRAFQKEFNKARKEKDTKRINELQKIQPRVMGLQAEMTGSQMKPMAVSMLVVVPLFAWLWEYITAFNYHFFSTPWNLHVDFFTREGIIFGSSILPHWILLYSVMSIPFGQILQKALKVWSWRGRLDHVLTGEPEVDESGA